MSDFKEYASKKFVEDHVKDMLSSFNNVSSWNDLTDKPFEPEKVYCEWDEEVEYGEYVESDTSYFSRLVKISDTTYPYDFFIGKPIYYSVDLGVGINLDFNEVLEEDHHLQKMDDNGDNFAIMDAIFVITTESLQISNNVILTQGIWCGDDFDTSAERVTKIKIFDHAIPIDESAIPDTIARIKDKPDWNQSNENSIGYIKNRPFYMDNSSMTVLANINDYNNNVWMHEGPLTATEAFIPDVVLEPGNEYSVIIDGNAYSGILENNPELDGMFGEGTMVFGDIDALLNMDLASLNFLLLVNTNDDGSHIMVYAMYPTDPVECTLCIGSPSAVQLDEKYIPNTIPRVSVAEVGQVIVVKEVDENGRPTEWEAVDLGSTNSYVNSTIYLDQTSSIKYHTYISNGAMVIQAECTGIEITTPPTYQDDGTFDVSVMVVEAVYADESRSQITDYAHSVITDESGTNTGIEVTYTEFGVNYTASYSNNTEETA